MKAAPAGEGSVNVLKEKDGVAGQVGYSSLQGSVGHVRVGQTGRDDQL